MKVKISLSIPSKDQTGKYFSIRLRSDLYDEPSEYKQASKLFAVSDIEGSYSNFVKLLIGNRVIDKNHQWIFGDGHLVIVGDCFDRGEQVIECLWLIYSLEERARRSGGYVHFILGNHEIMNLNGDWRYVHPNYAPKISSSKHRSTALYGANNELWRWLRTKNIIEKIGDILFVHGGISSELLKLNLSVTEINNLAKPHYTRATEDFTDPGLRTIFNTNLSPFWYRGQYRSEVKEDQIDAALLHFGVNTIVSGHTLVDRITAYYNGKLINIDTDHTVSNSEALVIKNNQYYSVTKKGKEKRLK